MYSHTRKVGSMGRYGPRVGRKLRDEAEKIEKEARATSVCPRCVKGKVKRLGAGIWRCKTCKYTFTGGTHISKIKHEIKEEEKA